MRRVGRTIMSPPPKRSQMPEYDLRTTDLCIRLSFGNVASMTKHT